MDSAQMTLSLYNPESAADSGDETASATGTMIAVTPAEDLAGESAAPTWIDVALVEAILRCDHAGRVIEAHGPGELLPVSREELIGNRVADLDALPAAFRRAWSETLDRTFDTQRAQIFAYDFDAAAGPRAFEARMLPLGTDHAAIAIRDVSERNHLRERIEHVAMHDTLTGLPNTRALREKLELWIGPGAREDASKAAPIVLLIVDLDRFKQSNDINGLSIGDSLLRLVAQRLSREAHKEAGGRPRSPDDADEVHSANLVDETSRVGERLLVARIGGDQFGIAWRMADTRATGDEVGSKNATGSSAMDVGTTDANGRSAALATRLITALATPTRLAGHTLFVRASIGMALAPADARDAATLFSHAEAALMRAKQAGRNQYRRHGDDDHDARAIAAIATMPPNNEAALRRALASGEFLLVYQPKFELVSSIVADAAEPGERGSLAPGAVIAVEALVRWRTSTGALLTPREFVPLAESSGIIRPLGDWVLLTALAEAARFAEQGGARVGVAINVSLWQLHDRAFVHSVEAALRKHGFAPGELTIEIAETAFLEDIRLVADTLAELSALGVRLAIDHFGVGTAGLVALKSLPISEIKIDRSFIAGAAIDAFDATIVAGLIEMAHNLGIVVTAEGVERADQLAALSQMRCDAIQGFFVGQPMRASELVAMPRLWDKTRRSLG
ncbi:MAG: putative bifunctional diguanylate cyclase/phosphodiesterase [Burkholderiaceae bacterium]